jgi:hypothetical protein
MADTIYETQQHLHHLCTFTRELAQRIETNRPAPGSPSESPQFQLKGECIQCGIRINDAELRSLGKEKPAGETDSRLERLRLGYCARKGCDSIYYRVSAAASSPIDWAKYFPDPNSLLLKTDHDQPDKTTPPMAASRLFSWRVLAIGLTLLTLILARQYYRGATIPFLREPEDFKVDHVERQH